MNTKIKKFQETLKKRDIHFALFYNLEMGFNPHMLYLYGYKGMGVLIIPATNQPFMLVPRMEFERAKSLNLKIIKFQKEKSMAENIKTCLKKFGIKHKTIGIDETLTSIHFFKKLKKGIKAKYRNIEEDMLELRAIKTPEEIALYRKACRLTDQILQSCLQKFKHFRTEKQVADFLESEAAKNNCTLSFEPIVASGTRGAQPHFSPQEHPIAKGFCTIDFGIRYKNYCTDLTRTVYTGQPSKAEIKDYNLVRDVQTKTIAMLKPEISCAKLESYARKLLGKKEKYFIHGLGHGIGIDIHEAPGLKNMAKEKIKENMIITIEPGIYISNHYGIRIEDDILITKNRHEILTKTSRELRIF